MTSEELVRDLIDLGATITSTPPPDPHSDSSVVGVGNPLDRPSLPFRPRPA